MWQTQEQTAVTKYSQLITTLFNRTGNLSHDFRLWRVDWHSRTYVSADVTAVINIDDTVYIASYKCETDNLARMQNSIWWL